MYTVAHKRVRQIVLRTETLNRTMFVCHLLKMQMYHFVQMRHITAESSITRRPGFCDALFNIEGGQTTYRLL